MGQTFRLRGPRDSVEILPPRELLHRRWLGLRRLGVARTLMDAAVTPTRGREHEEERACAQPSYRCLRRVQRQTRAVEVAPMSRPEPPPPCRCRRYPPWGTTRAVAWTSRHRTATLRRTLSLGMDGIVGRVREDSFGLFSATTGGIPTLVLRRRAASRPALA